MRPLGRRALPPALLVIALGLLSTQPVTAHIVLGNRPLQLLVADADVVARARILDTRGVPAASGLESQRPTVGALLLEVLKGDVPLAEVRFAQHGHGVASYEPGEEVLLFLQRIEGSRELGALAATGIAYVSLQEHDEKYLIPRDESPIVLAAVRAYARAERIPDANARLAALREVMLTLLGSGDPRLATSAVQTLALAAEVPLVTRDDLPVLLPLLNDTSLPIGVRLALLVELQRRALLADRSRWAALLKSTTGSDRTAVIRAAGRHPSADVLAALLALLAGEDDDAAREAAIALGWRGNAAGVQPLDAALAAEDRKLRMAAIRGLGGIGTPAARRVLEKASLSHPDPATRRRARAEATRLTGAAASSPR